MAPALGELLDALDSSRANCKSSSCGVESQSDGIMRMENSLLM